MLEVGDGVLDQGSCDRYGKNALDSIYFENRTYDIYS